MPSHYTTRRSNQSILKEINSEYSLEGLMLKLKLQYFSHLMWRTNSLENIPMLGKIKGKRRRGWQRIRWLDGIIDWMDMSLSKFREIVKNREAWCATVHGVTKSQTSLSYWTTTITLGAGNTKKKTLSLLLSSSSLGDKKASREPLCYVMYGLSDFPYSKLEDTHQSPFKLPFYCMYHILTSYIFIYLWYFLSVFSHPTKVKIFACLVPW